MKSRTKARVAALQTLYEVDLTDHLLGSVLADRGIDNDLDEAQYEFARLIAQGVFENRERLDQLIAAHAPEWPLDQVAVIDRNILRIALWELAFYRKTPLKVGINEAVELAKSFGTDSSPRFINGVLGSLVENIDALLKSIPK
ncbi:MAG TPA: transcription antitermination factor NusB [Anaerolineaceae bacterium]|jgi:N utilization substance protein B|nr:transcription antitermination factor NusB [Anaerolineaceae bacterium]